MKKLTKSAKIILTSVVSFVCVLAIVLGCVFGIKKPEEKVATPAQLLAKNINENVSQNKTTITSTAVYADFCSTQNIKYLGKNFFIADVSGKTEVVLYKEKSDKTYEYKKITDKEENGGFVENDADSYELMQYTEDYVILSSKYNTESEFYSSEVLKVICVSEYENPKVIYKLDAKDKGFYLSSDNICLKENFFVIYYFKDIDVMNFNDAKVDFVFGTLKNCVLAESDIITLKDKEIKIYLNEMDFNLGESYVYVRFKNDIYLLFANSNGVYSYDEFKTADDVTYKLYELKNNAVLVEKRTVLRNENSSIEKTVIEDSESATYDYYIVALKDKLQCKEFVLDSGYAKITTINSENLDYYYICQQKIKDHVLQYEYLSKYLDSEFKTVLSYVSHVNENVIYAKDEYFVTNYKILSQDGKIVRLLRDTGSSENQKIYNLAQSKITKDVFVVYCDIEIGRRYGLMKYDGSFVVNPEKSDFIQIYAVNGDYALGKDSEGNYYKINIYSGKSTLISDFYENENLLLIADYNFSWYLTNDSDSLKMYIVDGTEKLTEISKATIVYQTTDNGAIIEILGADDKKIFNHVDTGESINFNKIITPTTVSVNENAETAVADPYYSSTLNIKSSDGYDVGSATYSGSSTVTFTVTMYPGYYIPSITFSFSFWNSYDISFTSTIGADGGSTVSGDWSVSTSGFSYVYKMSQSNSAIFGTVRGFNSDTCTLSYTESAIRNIYVIDYSANVTIPLSSGYTSKAYTYTEFYRPSASGYTLNSIDLAGMDTATHKFTPYESYSYPIEKTTTTFTVASPDTYKCFRDLRLTYGTVTAKLNYTANMYFITYNANGGDGSNTTQKVTYGSTFTTKGSSTFTRFGYTLTSWNTKSDGSGTKYSLGSSYKYSTASGITLYAIWTANLNQILVSTDGGTIPSGANRFVVSSADYQFVQPIYDSDGVAVNYFKTNDTEAYVGFMWTSEAITQLIVSTSAEGVYYYKDENLTKTEYTDYTGTVTYKGTKYYYAAIVQDYASSLTYNVLNKELSATDNISGVKELIDSYYLWTSYNTWFSLVFPTKTGYIFKDWYVVMLGTDGDTHTHYYGTSSSSYSTTTSSSFRTSSTQNYFKNLVNVNKMWMTDIFAEWTPITYKMSYSYGGGSVSSANPTTATYDVAIELTSPTKTGYTFTGWTMSGCDETTHNYGSDSSCSISSTATSFTASSSLYTFFMNLTSVNGATITATANWSANAYYVNYVGNGGTFADSMYGDDVIIKSSTTYELCEMIYDYSSIFSYKTITFTLNAANTTDTIYHFYANINGKCGPVVISTNSSNVSHKYKIKSSIISSSTTNVTYSGYLTYGGVKYYYAAGTSGWIEEDNIHSGSIFFSKTSVNAFYEVTASSVVNAVSAFIMKYNRSLRVTSKYDTTGSSNSYNPTRTGYTISGYEITNAESGITHTYTVNGTTTDTLTSKTITGSNFSYKNLRATKNSQATATVKWRANSYNIKYSIGDGTWADDALNPNSGTYDSVFEVSIPEHPLGYVFSGWTITGCDTTKHYYGTTSSCSSSTSGSSIITTGTSYRYFKNLTSVDGGTVTFTAVWIPNSYYVVFVENGSGVTLSTSNLSASYNSEFSVKKPIRVGYTFAGWALTGLSDEISHYYRYTTSSSMVTFSSTNGSYVNPTNPNQFVLINSTNSSYSYFKNLHYVAGETVTMTANWTPNDYTITYHYPLNSDFSGFPNLTTVNTVTYMKNTKTQTVTFDQYFKTFANARYDGQANAILAPTGYNISSWVIVFNKTLSSGTTSSQSSSYKCTANSEFMMNYSFYTTHGGTASQISSIHAYPVFSSISITLKYYDVTSDAGFNLMSNYSCTSTVTVSYGGSFTLSSGKSYSKTLVGYFISPNLYSNGYITSSRYTSYSFNSTTYSASKGATIAWGIDNNYAYNPDNPVFYLYASYNLGTVVPLSLTTEKSVDLTNGNKVSAENKNDYELTNSSGKTFESTENYEDLKVSDETDFEIENSNEIIIFDVKRKFFNQAVLLKEDNENN